MGMIHKNLSFHYCACIIFVIIIVTTIMRRMIKGRVNRSFLIILGISFLTAVFDIWAVTLDNRHGVSIMGKEIAHTCYLLIHSILMPVCIVYILNLVDAWHMIRRKRYLFVGFFAPIVTVVVMLLLNPFTHLMFYINANHDYTRGSLFYILYFNAAVYLGYGIFILFYFRNWLRRRYTVSFFVFWICELTAVAIQLIHPELLVEMFGMAAGLLFLSLMIQRPEEQIDTVTGLNKMTAYMDKMRLDFRNKKPMRIIMLNVTNYSTIRDLIGYEKNMEVVEKIAQYLSTVNREQKLDADLYYLEHGKFRLVVEERSFDKVRQTAELIRKKMTQNMTVNQMAVNFVANICITDCPQDISDVDTLMAFGDELNRIVSTGEIMWASEQLKHSHFDMMREMDNIIENALAKKRFSVYYQPIYSVNEKRFHSAEALLRLEDEKYGFVSPELFIPAAERSGAIHKIGDYVLEEVCKFISKDVYKELNLDYIEVNLSVVQCMQPKLVKHVMDILERYQVKPEQINLEITETAASISQQVLMNNIEELTSAGIRFSLDDFGTGYSNMQRVVTLPLDIIKLDRTFTEVHDNPKLAIVLTNTIQMIKAMNMKIVVEGVETEDMVHLFSRLECEYIQGYFFSKPMPQDEFIKFIQASL